MERRINRTVSMIIVEQSIIPDEADTAHVHTTALADTPGLLL